MHYNDIFDEVISGLQPGDLPGEYITMARVVDHFGAERILRGIELEVFLANPKRADDVAEARVILDVKKIRATIIAMVVSFFDELHARIADLPPMPAVPAGPGAGTE